jgi:hypothetical protein
LKEKILENEYWSYSEILSECSLLGSVSLERYREEKLKMIETE